MKIFGIKGDLINHNYIFNSGGKKHSPLYCGKSVVNTFANINLN